MPGGEGWKIVSWNVNGLRAHLKETAPLEGLARLASGLRPEIICLQEIKLNPSDCLKLGSHIVEGYQTFWNCCETSKKVGVGYAGTAVLVRNDVTGEVLVAPEELGAGGLNEEGRAQVVETDSFVLLNTCAPNSGKSLERLDWRVKVWDKAVRAFLVSHHPDVSGRRKNVIWCGDLSVAHTPKDVHNPQGSNEAAAFTPQERNSFSETLEKGFIDTYRHFHPTNTSYTYWSSKDPSFRNKNKGWRLDYFIVDSELLSDIARSDILAEYNKGSDHCPILLVLKGSASVPAST